MSPNELDSRYLDLDDLTKKGHRQMALEKLNQLLRDYPLPKDQLARFAQIASRNGAHLTTLKILSKEILKMQETLMPTLSNIIVTYANALQFLGANQEAKKILILGEETPEKILAFVFVLFSEWKYEQAIPLLKKYIKTKSITSYQRLVGYINLLAAYSTLSKIKETKDTILVIDQLFQEHPTANILRGNFHEIKTQIYILEKEFNLATQSINVARELLSPYGGRYLLFVEKWEALLLAESDSGKAIELLKLVKEKARLLNSLETVRDCDFHIARLMNDYKKLQRVLLATPSNGYRRKNIKSYNFQFKSQTNFLCNSMDFSKSTDRIDLALDEIMIQLNRSEQIVIQTVVNDLYRPPRMGMLFHALYPDEYFNPYTSPMRVRNTIKRLNDSLMDLKVPIRFEFKKGQLKMIHPSDLIMLIPQRAKDLSESDILLNLIRSSFKGRSFSEKQIKEKFGLNQFQSKRLLKRLVEEKGISLLNLDREKRFMCFNRKSFK